jgi:Flp pilus assembly protein TadD
VKRAIIVIGVLAVGAVGGGLFAYQAAARQRDHAALLARGDNALRDDQPFAAIEAYSGAIALRPDSMLAYLRRGQTYRRRGDRDDLEVSAIETGE